MSSTKQSRNKPSLNEVKQHFSDWRNTRSKHSRIPDELWGYVLDLIGHYSLDEISTSLNVSTKQIQARLDIYANTVTFVEAQPKSLLVNTPQHRLLLAVEPVDFRRGIDGLKAICQRQLLCDPFSGTIFAFTNRARTSVKLLVFDASGF